jgi:hypothetical protein
MSVPIAESILSLADHVRRCEGCQQIKGGTQFRMRRAGGRRSVCRACESIASPEKATELAKVTASMRTLKGRLTRLEHRLADLQRVSA